MPYIEKSITFNISVESEKEADDIKKSLMDVCTVFTNKELIKLGKLKDNKTKIALVKTYLKTM